LIVVLRDLDYEELKAKLDPDDRIIVWSCNDCTKYCGLGGRKNLNTLADALEKDGYNILRRELVGVSCQLNLIRERTKHPSTKEIFDEATAIIVLACTDGFLKVQRVFRKKKVIQIGISVGLGTYSKKEGMKLVIPLEETGLEPSVEGMSLDKAAKKLNLKSGPIV
jgi:coenzyme F420-reducing hydrogenase beta subunit